MKQLDVDLWEAWIDMQSVDSKDCPTLYVVGDVFTNDKIAQPYFHKLPSVNPTVLALEILPALATEDGYIMEVLFAEELEHIDQYDTILIYFKNELITSITEIEKTY